MSRIAFLLLLAACQGPLAGQAPPPGEAGCTPPEFSPPPLSSAIPATLYAQAEFLFQKVPLGDTTVQPIQDIDAALLRQEDIAVVSGVVLAPDRTPLPCVRVGVVGHPEYGHTVSRKGRGSDLPGRFDLALPGGTALTLQFTLTPYPDAFRQVSLPPLQAVRLEEVVLGGAPGDVIRGTGVLSRGLDTLSYYGPPPNYLEPPSVNPHNDETMSGHCSEKGQVSYGLLSIDEYTVLDCQHLTAGYDLPLDEGSLFKLHYGSNQVPGYRAAAALQVPVTGANYSQGLRPQRVRVVAWLPLRPWLDTEFTGDSLPDDFTYSGPIDRPLIWDGLGIGMRQQGETQAWARTYYTYPAQRYNAPQPLPPGTTYNLGPSGEPETIVIPPRNWQPASLRARNIAVEAQMGGFSLNIHHGYDADQQKLLLGTGEVVDATPLLPFDVRRAGGQVQPGRPVAVTSLSDETTFIADAAQCSVWHLNEDVFQPYVKPPGGITSPHCLAPLSDGEDRDQARIAEPISLAYGSDDNLYIGSIIRDSHDRSRITGGIVRAVHGTLDKVYNVAGTGMVSDSLPPGTAGSATLIGLAEPTGLVLARSLSGPLPLTLYVVDRQNGQVRRIGVPLHDGAGESPGLSWGATVAEDHGVVLANLSNPTGIALQQGKDPKTGQPQHVLYISETGRHQVLRAVVRQDGTVTAKTYIGTPGEYGYDPAHLNVPEGLALTAAGVLYIADTGNRIVRRIDTGTGTIDAQPVAGIANMAAGPGCDDTVRLGAEVSFVEAGALAYQGSTLYVTDPSLKKTCLLRTAPPGSPQDLMYLVRGPDPEHPAQCASPCEYYAFSRVKDPVHGFVPGQHLWTIPQAQLQVDKCMPDNCWDGGATYSFVYQQVKPDMPPLLHKVIDATKAAVLTLVPDPQSGELSSVAAGNASTSVTAGTDGFVNIVRRAGQTWKFEPDNSGPGLVHRVTPPSGTTHVFTYSPSGSGVLVQYDRYDQEVLTRTINLNDH